MRELDSLTVAISCCGYEPNLCVGFIFSQPSIIELKA